jgi:hypothetical protein
LKKNKQEHEETLKNANFELVKQGYHQTCSHCGLHSSLLDYGDDAHSTSNGAEEGVTEEGESWTASCSTICDTSIVTGGNNAEAQDDDDDQEAGAPLRE